MSGIQALNTLPILIYLGGLSFTAYKLLHSYRPFWEDSPDLDVRQLASWIALFLLTPVGVLLHGLGQMAAAYALGHAIYGLDYSIYWIHLRSSIGTPLEEWYIALAGNVTSYSLGIACLLAGTFGSKIRRPLRLVLADVGVIKLAWTLMLVPLWTYYGRTSDEWAIIYSFRLPAHSSIVLVVHVLSILGYFAFMRQSKALRRLLDGSTIPEGQTLVLTAAADRETGEDADSI